MTLPTPYSAPEHSGLNWPAGPAHALLIHGFPGTPAEMQPVARLLHERGWSVHAPLLPGFGPQIESMGSYGYREWLAAVQSELTDAQARYETVLIGGLSMGAALATVAATKATHPPAGLLLFAPFWRIEQRLLDATYPLARLVLRKIQPFKNADFSSAEMRRSLAYVYDDDTIDNPAMQEQLRQLALPTSLLGAVRRAGKQGYRAAPRVQSPTLIIQGTRDEVARPALTQKLAARIPTLHGLVELPAPHTITNPDTLDAATWHTLANAVVEFAELIDTP